MLQKCWDWMRLPREMRFQIKRLRTGPCRVEEEPTKMNNGASGVGRSSGKYDILELRKKVFFDGERVVICVNAI